MSKIQDSLQKLFDKHRVVVWYDAAQNLQLEYAAIDIPEVQKLEVNNNELAIKYRLYMQEPQQKFLLYLPKERPENTDNWLLDVELAYHVYNTDEQSLYLQELGLGYHLHDWAGEHIEFFRNKQRLQKLTALAESDDTQGILRAKMMQVIFGADIAEPDIFLRQYTTAFIDDKYQSIDRELERFNLHDSFWQAIEKRYGYKSAQPGIYDFLIALFSAHFAPTASQYRLSGETGVLLSNWKDARSFEQTFKAISGRIQADLNIESKLSAASIDQVIGDDNFQMTDPRIIAEVVHQVTTDAIDAKRLDTILKKRESKYWYDNFSEYYHAIEEGFLLLQFIRKNSNVRITDFHEGIKLYADKLYEADLRYRKFIEHYRAANQSKVLAPLYAHIDKAYTNSWLLPLCDHWQQVVEQQTDFPWHHMYSLRQFFSGDVQPFIDKRSKVFVIISDALRYECGVEFFESIQKENRFTGKLSYRYACLPSYTQLGMASLLPHKQLSFGQDNDDVLVDSLPSKGLDTRRRILEYTGHRATAIGAEDLMSKPREWNKDYDVVYVYHNRIDDTGDNTKSEDKLAEAVRDELQFLKALVKKIFNMNGTNVLITADHGFIYQNEPLAESDFADADVHGDIHKFNRRFVIGRGLTFRNNVVAYTGAQLGIESDVQVLIPKGLNRLKVQGAGSRFVHGGLSLQELVVPVISIYKKREDTVSKVDVDILNKSNTRISTNLQGVQFYQTRPTGDQVVGRSIKAYFKGDGDDIVSDVFQYTFDSASVNASDREKYHGFQISAKAGPQYRNKTVNLIIEEQIDGTTSWVEYARYPYTVNISFTNDFDDF